MIPDIGIMIALLAWTYYLDKLVGRTKAGPVVVGVAAGLSGLLTSFLVADILSRSGVLG